MYCIFVALLRLFTLTNLCVVGVEKRVWGGSETSYPLVCDVGGNFVLEREFESEGMGLMFASGREGTEANEI